MQTDFTIGKTSVSLNYTKTKETDSYEYWGQKGVDSGYVSELHSVFYKGKPISLSYEWEEAARRYIENL